MTETPDRTALIERMAAAMWSSRDVTPWEEAGPHWQPLYRALAEASLAVVEASEKGTMRDGV